MSYAIVGFGAVGQALRPGLAVRTIQGYPLPRREPPAARGVAPQARAIWTHGRRQSLRDATRGRHNHLGGPFGEHREVAKALPSWKGKTVIDTMNALVPLRSWTVSRPPPSSRRRSPAPSS